MNFATKAFMIFLPCVLLIYHSLPTRRLKFTFLLLASWGFYASWNPWYLWVILFTTTVDYTAGRLIAVAQTPAGKRGWLVASLLANLGLLAYFKYTLFAVQNGIWLAEMLGYSATAPDWALRIILPLGISFHTFQGISYTIDVYRGKLPAVRSYRDFALFVAFFPQLVAGPIVRASEFLPQLVQPPRVSAAQVQAGLQLCIYGLFKKVFIADRLGQDFVDVVFADPAGFAPATHALAMLAYMAQIYCDFSGYSDLAVGCAKFFGFEIPRNFNFPYLATSITDFWRRWHITLSSWLRDYLYISLGGNRAGTLRTYANLVVTMTACGLWHGASWGYVLWGVYNGLLLSAHRVWDRFAQGRAWVEAVRAHPLYRGLAWAATMWLVATGLVLVRTQDLATAWVFESALLGLGPATPGAAVWLPVWVWAMVGLVAVEHGLGGTHQPGWALQTWPSVVRAAVCGAAVVLLVVLGPWVSRPFIYFQF